MQGYRAALLRFDADGVLQRVDDALVIVDQGRILEADAFAAVAARHCSAPSDVSRPNAPNTPALASILPGAPQR